MGQRPLQERRPWRVRPTRSEGGESRQQSVQNALASIKDDTDLVAVHDAVRPFVSREVIEKVIQEAHETGAAIVGIVPVDTVKQVQRNKVRATLPREQLILTQTPQVFRLKFLRQAFEKAKSGSICRHRRILISRTAGGSGSLRSHGQRPQHQDHQAHRHGPCSPLPRT